MNIEAFVTKACQGGWEIQDKHLRYGEHEEDTKYCVEAILLDSLARQAVGKVEGWYTRPEIPEGHCEVCGKPMPQGETMFKFHGYSGPCPAPMLSTRTFRDDMHRMIDALAEGKTVEEYLATL